MAHSEELAARITQSVERLFGGSELATTLTLEANRYQQDCLAIRSGRGVTSTTVAFTGPTGHGKTSLARLLIHDEAALGQLRAGALKRDRSTHVTWVGPRPPDAVNPAYEQHVFCSSKHFSDLGKPVAFIDTPGWSNRSDNLVQIAEDALHSAQLHLLVVKREGIERADVIEQSRRSAGAAVLPIIRTRDLQEPELAADLDTFHEALQQAGGTVFKPLVVPDIDVAGPEAWDDVRSRLVGSLTSTLAAMPSRETLVTRQLTARTRQLRRHVRQALAGVHDRVQEALADLEQEAAQLPAEVIAAALGDDRMLEAGLRARMRVELAERTWALWFPYRSVLSTVQLTYGAWDRLLLAMGGSLPSWFGTLFAAGRQLWNASSFDTSLTALQERLTTSATDRLGPLLLRFDRALHEVTGGEHSRVQPGAVRLEGLSKLQEKSVSLIDSVVARYTVSPFLANLWALLCTGLFWGLFCGPVIALYRRYLKAGTAALQGHVPLGDFPTPSLSFWLTSLVLSLLPMLLTTTLFVSGSANRRRIHRAAAQVRADHNAAIHELQELEELRLVLSDERLADARFLLQL